MQILGYRSRDNAQLARSLRDMDHAQLRALGSSYKCRIARKAATESDFKNFLRCQRELSRRL